MKTPEEWLKEWSFFEKIPTRELSSIIKETQKEAWNEALDRVLENGKVDSEIQWYDPYDYSKGVDGAVGFINKESILKGKI